MAERVDEAALPVDAPRHLMITDLVDAAIGSGCYGALDEAVRVIDEHFDADRPRQAPAFSLRQPIERDSLSCQEACQMPGSKRRV
jgi:hypothetical protein